VNGQATTRYAFAGPVRCERRGAQLLLVGVARARGVLLRLVLAGAERRELPAVLDDLEVSVRGSDGAPGRCELRWRQGTAEFGVRGAHALWRADAATAATLAGMRPTRLGRWGWAILLNLVRLPGVTRLLQAIRGAG